MLIELFYSFLLLSIPEQSSFSELKSFCRKNLHAETKIGEERYRNKLRQ